jgi:hypothetical protein
MGGREKNAEKGDLTMQCISNWWKECEIFKK